MIGRISGVLVEKNPLHILVDCEGIGYEISVPMSTFYNLPDVGQKVILITHFHVRDDNHSLYGFNTLKEREVFRELIKISGVGTRTALSLLSGLSLSDFFIAISSQKPDLLTTIPGIGKKTAERLLLELKGKLEVEINLIVKDERENSNDILKALLTLGYSEKEARISIKKLPSDITIVDGIKLALQDLSKV